MELPSLTKQVCFRIKEEIYDMLEALCFTEVDGMKVQVHTNSKWAKEFFIKGMKMYYEEKRMTEKATLLEDEEKRE